MKNWAEISRKIIAILSLVVLLAGTFPGIAEQAEAPQEPVLIEEEPITEKQEEQAAEEVEAPTAEPTPAPTAVPTEEPAKPTEAVQNTPAPTKAPEATKAPTAAPEATQEAAKETATPEPTEEPEEVPFSAGYVRVIGGDASLYPAAVAGDATATLPQGAVAYAAAREDARVQVYYSDAGTLESGWAPAEGVADIDSGSVQAMLDAQDAARVARYGDIALPDVRTPEETPAPTETPEVPVEAPVFTFDTLFAPIAKDLAQDIPTGIDIKVGTDVLTYYKHNYIVDGTRVRLTAEVSPATASQAVTWTVNDATIATVSDTGVVTSLKKSGTVTVTATTRDQNQIVGFINIYFNNLPDDIELSPSYAHAGESLNVVAKPSPEGTAFDSETKFSIITGTEYAEIGTYGALAVKSNVTAKQVITIRVDHPSSGMSVDKDMTLYPLITSLGLRDATTTDTVSSLTIGLKTTRQLYTTVAPKDAHNTMRWTTSNAKVATVDSDGLVKGVGLGTATITATARDGSGKSKTCEVTVESRVTDIKVTGDKTVASGKQITLKASITPANASNPNVVWSSSDTSVATVNGNGVVTGKDVTQATDVVIQATTTDGSALVGSRTVTVRPLMRNLIITDAGGSQISTKTIDMTADPTSRLYASFTPADASDDITWKSSNKAIVKVGATGKLTAVAPGTTTVVAFANDGSGETAICQVVVKKLPAKIALSGAKKMGSGEKQTLTAKVTPKDATSTAVTWKSSDKSVAKVSSKGVVTAKTVTQPTQVTITATAKGNTSVTKSITITVYPTAKSIQITWQGKVITREKVEVSDLPNYRMKLQVEASPSGANTAVTWKSSDKSIASITAGGNVKPKKAGTVTITATTKDSRKAKASVTLTFTAHVDTVRISGTSYISSGEQRTLKASIKPAAATDKSLNWRSSNPNIATVDDRGVVTAKSVKGIEIITITATARDGSGATDTFVLTVYPKTTSLTIQQGGTKKTSVLLPLTGSKATMYLTAVQKPNDARQKVSWSSSNASIAKISSGGKVTATKPGTVTITARAADGSGVRATCTVTVYRPASGVTITGAKTVSSLNSVKLTAKVLPATATNLGVTWKSSNTNVATVAQTGIVTAKSVSKKTTVTITATAKDGSGTKGTYILSVLPRATGLALYDSDDVLVTAGILDLTGTKKGTITLTPKSSPNGASNSVTWATSNNKVATVNANGKVTAVAVGTATITATTTDGSKQKATYAVTVTTLQSGIALSFSPPAKDVQLVAGINATIGLTVTPSTAANTGVTWSSTDPTLATVSSSGVVTPNSSISSLKFVTITARANDESGLKGSIRLSIRPATSSITLRDEDNNALPTVSGEKVLTITKGSGTKTYQMKKSISPADTYEVVSWSTSSQSTAGMVTVDAETGELTIKSTGTFYLTCSAQDGSGKTAVCKVVVK